jgi:hypothetical protein
MTRSVNPRNQAVWQLPDLYDFLCEWAYLKCDAANLGISFRSLVSKR